jgi:hypothetical protein
MNVRLVLDGKAKSRPPGLTPKNRFWEELDKNGQRQEGDP